MDAATPLGPTDPVIGFMPSNFFRLTCPIRMRHDAFIKLRGSKDSVAPQHDGSNQAIHNMKNGVAFEEYIICKVMGLEPRTCPPNCGKKGPQDGQTQVVCDGIQRFMDVVQKCVSAVQKPALQNEMQQELEAAQSKSVTHWEADLPQLHIVPPSHIQQFLHNNRIHANNGFADLVKVGYRMNRSVQNGHEVSTFYVVIKVIDVKYSPHAKRYHKKQIACYIYYIMELMRGREYTMTLDPLGKVVVGPEAKHKSVVVFEGAVWIPRRHHTQLPSQEHPTFDFRTLKEGVKEHFIQPNELRIEFEYVKQFLLDFMPKQVKLVCERAAQELRSHGVIEDPTGIRHRVVYSPTEENEARRPGHASSLPDMEDFLESNVWRFNPELCHTCEYKSLCEAELVYRIQEHDPWTITARKMAPDQGPRLISPFLVPQLGITQKWSPNLCTLVFTTGNQKTNDLETGSMRLWNGELHDILGKVNGRGTSEELSGVLDQTLGGVKAQTCHQGTPLTFDLGSSQGRLEFLKFMDQKATCMKIRKDSQDVFYDAQCLVPSMRAKQQLHWLLRLFRASQPGAVDDETPGVYLSFWLETRTSVRDIPEMISKKKKFDYTPLNVRLFSFEQMVAGLLELPWAPRTGGAGTAAVSETAHIAASAIQAIPSVISMITIIDAFAGAQVGAQHPAVVLQAAAANVLQRALCESVSTSFAPRPYFGWKIMNSKNIWITRTAELQDIFTLALRNPSRGQSAPIVKLLYAMLLYEIRAQKTIGTCTDVYQKAVPIVITDGGKAAHVVTTDITPLQTIVEEAVKHQMKNKFPKLNNLPPISVQLWSPGKEKMMMGKWKLPNCSAGQAVFSWSKNSGLLPQGGKSTDGKWAQLELTTASGGAVSLADGPAFLLPVPEYKDHMYNCLFQYAVEKWVPLFSDPKRKLVLERYFTAKSVDSYAAVKNSVQLFDGSAAAELKLKNGAVPTEDQRRVLASVCGPLPITVLWGPPGTGKTATLAAVVSHLFVSCPAEAKRRVLITGPTNTAIEVLYTAMEHHRALGLLPSTVQLVPLHRRTDSEGKELKGSCPSLEAKCIVFSTVFRCATTILPQLDATQKLFDVLVIDEASMVPVTHAALAAELLCPSSHKIIVAGDLLQLPPIQAEMVIPSNAGESFNDVQNQLLQAAYPGRENIIADVGSASVLQAVFGPNCRGEHLSSVSGLHTFCGERLPQHVVQLRQSFRSVPSLVNLIAYLYPAGLYSSLPEMRRSGVHFCMVAGRKVDRAANSTLLTEAEAVVKLVKEAEHYSSHDAPISVTVATPHRSQKFTISRAVEDSKLASGRVLVDTVERTQGSEADWVVLCYGPDVRVDSAFGYHLCRMNVSVSRAKTRVVVLLDPIKAQLLGNGESKMRAADSGCAADIAPAPFAHGAARGVEAEKLSERRVNESIAEQGWELLRRIYRAAAPVPNW